MLRKIKNIQRIYTSCRHFRYSASLRNNENDEKDKKDITSSVATKFQVFRNESVGVIFDIEEERAKKLREAEEGVVEEERERIPPHFADVNLEHGLTGVFDVEDLVDVLQKENAADICVIKIPEHYAYVDYMVIVTGSSYRHMVGMANFVRRIYKMKRHKGDAIPRIEGEECKNWMAMDLGNIALHIFSDTSRKHYDLESLWVLGEEYEKRIKGRDEKLEMYEEFFTQNTTDRAENLDEIESKRELIKRSRFKQA